MWNRGPAASRGRGARCELKRRSTRAELKGGKSRTEWKDSRWHRPWQPDEGAKLALLRNFEFKLPLVWLLATPSDSFNHDRAQGRRDLDCRHQQTSPALQPVAEPLAGRFFAAGGMDRAAGGERRRFVVRGVRDARRWTSRQNETSRTLVVKPRCRIKIVSNRYLLAAAARRWGRGTADL